MGYVSKITLKSTRGIFQKRNEYIRGRKWYPSSRRTQGSACVKLVLDLLVLLLECWDSVLVAVLKTQKRYWWILGVFKNWKEMGVFKVNLEECRLFCLKPSVWRSKVPWLGFLLL